MRKAAITAIFMAGMTLGGCATNDRYGYDDRNNRQIERAATGAAIGAAAGAGLGAVVGGVGVAEGAAAGAVLGGVAGAVTGNNDRRFYRDARGDCYWVDDRGNRIYDYGRRC